MFFSRQKINRQTGGFGLIEFLIGVTLFFILIIGVLYGSFQAQKKTYDVEIQKIALRRNLQLIMEELSQELRMAQALTVNTGNAITFTSVQDGNTRSFTWSGETLTYVNGSETKNFSGIIEFTLAYPASNKVSIQIRGKTAHTTPIYYQTLRSDVTLRNV